MSNDSYIVPTLSLTNSRSRKNIPTKDAYQPRTYLSETANMPPTPISYLQKKQQQTQMYTTQNRYTSNYTNLPPRPKMNEVYSTQNTRQSAKQITRNVYLTSEEESTQNINNYQQYRNQPTINSQNINTYQHQQYRNQPPLNSANIAVQRARQVLRQSGSRGSLLGNPQSRIQVESQVKRQTNNMEFKKIDINKALFDRKLAKIMQQIDFYQQQLDGLYTQSLADHIDELQDIKKQNKQAQNKILKDLNSLIA